MNLRADGSGQMAPRKSDPPSPLTPPSVLPLPYRACSLPPLSILFFIPPLLHLPFWDGEGRLAFKVRVARGAYILLHRGGGASTFSGGEEGGHLLNRGGRYLPLLLQTKWRGGGRWVSRLCCQDGTAWGFLRRRDKPWKDERRACRTFATCHVGMNARLVDFVTYHAGDKSTYHAGMFVTLDDLLPYVVL